MFFLFGGFHCAYCIYMCVHTWLAEVILLKSAAAADRFIGIPSTGSAGLINTIHAFSTASIVTGVFGVIATVGVRSFPSSNFLFNPVLL